MIGKDESGFEAIYNSSEFIQKIEIEIEENGQGLFDAEEVLEKLLKSLRKIQGVIHVQAA